MSDPIPMVKHPCEWPEGCQHTPKHCARLEYEDRIGALGAKAADFERAWNEARETRDAALEEAAKVAESAFSPTGVIARTIAAEIRSLKSSPPSTGEGTPDGT